MDNAAKTIGRTICDVLLTQKHSDTQQQQNLISSYEKQVQAMEALRSLAPEEKQKLLSSTSHDNQALKVKTLLKIDSLQNSIFGSSLPVLKTTTMKRIEENEEEIDDEENQKQRSEMTSSSSSSHQLLLQQIIQEARTSCQIHRLPRPGTEQFFGVSSAVGNNSTSSQRESGKRRQRTDDGHEEENNENQEQHDISDMFDLGRNGKPVVDGVSFVALATCVARSLTTGKKFEEFVEKRAIDLSTISVSKEGRNHGSRNIKGGNADDSSNEDNSATYRLVHLVVTLVLNLFRRMQCYSQCELDLQSRIVEQQNKLVSTMKTEIENERDETGKKEPASVSLVRRALKNCKHPAQKMDGERFLNVSVSDPVRSQRTFYNSQAEDRIVTVAAGSSRGGKNEEMKLVGKLKVSRLAVHAAIDSMKQ